MSRTKIRAGYLFSLGIGLLVMFSPNLHCGEKSVAKEKKVIRRQSVRDVLAIMAEPVLVEKLGGKMELGKGLENLKSHLATRGITLEIEIDQDGFQFENPEAPPPLEADVKLARFPRFLTVSQILDAWVRQIPTMNGAFVLRPGYVLITTSDKAVVPVQAQQPIEGAYVDTHLNLAIEDLYQKTGVPIVLDKRFAWKARTRVSAKFHPQTPMATALRLLAEMADLKVVMLPDVIFVTSPENARQMMMEQMYWEWIRFRWGYLYPRRIRLGIPDPLPIQAHNEKKTQ